MIDVQNLTKYYGRVCAVRGISFHVREGEIVGFLGPNGAGKTTTLRVLTCYHPATSGTAKVAGHDVFRESLQVRQNIGYLPESVPLYLEMRVIEYLKFRAKLRGIPPARRQAAIDRVAELCWIRDVIRRPIGQLSKGYRQRVALADALLHDPPVLILDEPTVGLDPAQIRETRSLIRSLAPAHTILFSSHILPEVEAICDRILIIHQGRLIASGTAEELRSRAADGVCVVAEVRATCATGWRACAARTAGPCASCAASCRRSKTSSSRSCSKRASKARKRPAAGGQKADGSDGVREPTSESRRPVPDSAGPRGLILHSAFCTLHSCGAGPCVTPPRSSSAS